MQENLFYTAQEVQKMLGVSRGKAYQVVRELNEQLAQRGFIVVAGKIPKKIFQEHFYGLETQQKGETVSVQLA